MNFLASNDTDTDAEADADADVDALRRPICRRARTSELKAQ